MSAFRESRSDKRSGTVYRPDPRSHFSPISPISRLSSRRGRLFLGFLFSSCIGLLAYRRRSLTRDGAAGAVVTGTTIFGLGGWPWGLSLIYFFLSSTLLSHFREKEKEHVAADKFSKGAQRDLAQVAANGSLAALCATASGVTNSQSLQQVLEVGFAGALATATADTWATELGVLSHAEPRLITSGRTVAPGTSGGITLPGLVASALGACTFGLVLWATQGLHKSRADLPAISLLSGQAGSLCDSLLGATVQAMYFCPICRCETERVIHSCGTHTRLLRGLPWCNNDIVNFFATLAGACTAITLHGITRGISFLLQKKTPAPPEL
jgi:uncharacterized protein (TIGR00297 family)